MKMKALFIFCLLFTISFSSINPDAVIGCFLSNPKVKEYIVPMTEVFSNLDDYKGLIRFINRNFKKLKDPLRECLNSPKKKDKI